MTDPTPTAPASTTPAPKLPRDNALQNKAHANAIGSSERSIKAALGSPTLLLAIASSGYNENRLNSGLQLAAKAQTAFGARQSAMAVASAAHGSRKTARQAAKTEFVSYRATVQTNYTEADRANLGASGRIPADGEKFITTARGAYSTALTPPHLAKLSEYGYDEERLKTLLASLDALTSTNSAADNAASAAQTATEARNTAVKELKNWTAQLRKIAKNKLKDRPDLFSLLKS